MAEDHIVATDIQQFPSEFGITFQETVIYCVLADPKFATSVIEVLEPKYFTTIYLHTLAKIILDYKNKYKVLPPSNILKNEIMAATKEDKRLRSEILEIVNRIFSESLYRNGADYVKEHTLNFCRVQKLDQSLIKAYNMIHATNNANFDNVRRVIQNGFMYTSDKTLTNYKQTFDDRLLAVTENVPRVKTGFREINELIRGGIGIPVKKLCLVLAFVSGGKTSMLVDMGCAAMCSGHNVLHISLEDEINDVCLKYDSNISGISAEAFLMDKANQKLVADALSKIPGNLYIKEYPGRTASILTIKNHIEKMIEEGNKPSVVIVDYIAEVKPADKRERRHELADISRDLRAIAVEYECVVWTAAQSQRGTVHKRIVKLEQIGEAFEITHPVDFMLTIGQTMKDAADGTCKLFVAKNKIGKDLKAYTATFSKELSRFAIKEELDASTLDLDSVGFNMDDFGG